MKIVTLKCRKKLIEKADFAMNDTSKDNQDVQVDVMMVAEVIDNEDADGDGDGLLS